MSGPGTAREIVYLDCAATTPLDPRVADAMSGCLRAGDLFGNPSSTTHALGRRASARIEAAREAVAALIGAAADEIVFTSGATESNNLAILGIARANADRGRHIVTSRTEHKAVLDPCRQLEKEGFAVTWLTPDPAGRIDPARVRGALRPDTVLVSLMHVNNETGVVQDIAAIGAACRAHGVPFHTDAAQSAGKLPLDCGSLPVDFLSFTAHKIYGPKGIGALYVRRASRGWLQPVSYGGGQERGLRPGTLPTHQIVGFATACELAARLHAAEATHLAGLRERLWSGLAALGGVHLNGGPAPRVAGLLNVSFEGVEGESLVAGLTELAVSTGSACSSAAAEPSYVLRSLGRSTELAQSSLRFGLGRFTTADDIERALAAVRREVPRLRAVSPAAAEDAPAPAVSPSAAAAGAVASDTLAPLVRELFARLPRAGRFPAGFPHRIVSGEAGSEAEGTWVRFHLAIERGSVKDARFQAYGCPHTLAAAAWLTARLPGRSRSDGVPDSPPDWARELSVPVEKLGRLLLIEDALHAALQEWT